MGSWSELPADMLRQIAVRVNIAADRVRFSAVCKNWLQIATSEPRYFPPPPPWIMLAEIPGTSVRSFVGLNAGDKEEDPIFDLDFPEGQYTRCVGSTGSWITTVNLWGKIHLQNPFTGEKQIELPPVSGLEDHAEYVEVRGPVPINSPFVPRKVVISNSDADGEFISMTVYDGTRMLAFARRCSNSWTTVNHERKCFIDFGLYNGNDKFYGVNVRGVVFECDINSPGMRPISEELTNFDAPCRYLVECCGMLLQVLKIIDDIDKAGIFEAHFKTIRFEIYKLELGKWIKLNDLGRLSLFVGINTSVALLADELSTFKPNCIYFTDDHYITMRQIRNGRDMGVFSLADGTIKPHYRGVSLSFLSPPIWIVPSSLYKGCQSPFLPKKDPNHQVGPHDKDVIISGAESSNYHSNLRCSICRSPGV